MKNHEDGLKITVSPYQPVSLSPRLLVSLRGALLALVFCQAVGIAPVYAHGGGKAQLTSVPVGPYHLFAWTSPDPWRVGNAHTTVAVTKALADGQEMPVEGAQVVVTYVPLGEQGAVQRVTAAELGGTQPGFYEADAQVPSTGDWEVRIVVTGPEGSGSASFTTQVLPAENYNWWLVGGAVMVVLVVVGFLGTRSRKPGRATAPAAGNVSRSRP